MYIEPSRKVKELFAKAGKIMNVEEAIEAKETSHPKAAFSKNKEKNNPKDKKIEKPKWYNEYTPLTISLNHILEEI